MHILLDNFHQCGKYTAQIAIHLAELRREGNFTDQKYLSITSIQTDYLNIDSSSSSGKKQWESKYCSEKGNFCGGAKHSAEKYF